MHGIILVRGIWPVSASPLRMGFRGMLVRMLPCKAVKTDGMVDIGTYPRRGMVRLCLSAPKGASSQVQTVYCVSCYPSLNKNLQASVFDTEDDRRYNNQGLCCR